MLYDQGQLLSVYTEAWRRSGCTDESLLWPVRETVEFLRRELTGTEGGLYASLDADSEGEEGTFYVFTPAQLQAVLGSERAAVFARAYGVSESGNFERGASVLRDVAREPRSNHAAEREELRVARAKRPAPGTDRKRVASWNALAISGLARAGSLIGDASMLDDARRAADFVLEQMLDAEGRLLRVWGNGAAKVPAFLDDHAALLEALLDLQRAGAGESYLAAALRVADAIVDRFYDPDENDLFLTPSDGEPLVHRPRSDHDGATPHSTGLAVLGLLRAASLSGREDLARVAAAVLRNHAFELERTPEVYPTLARAALASERGLSLALVIGPRGEQTTEALAACARRVLCPEDAVVVTAPGETPTSVDPSWLKGREPRDGRPTAYVCRGVSCSLPVTEPDALVPLASGETV
jgi:uncharacterized protein YyaL (SSP411 family)